MQGEWACGHAGAMRERYVGSTSLSYELAPLFFFV